MTSTIRCADCPTVVHGDHSLAALLRMEGHQEVHDPESPIFCLQKEVSEP